MRFYLILIVTIPHIGFGQISSPKFSNEFLSIGVGATGLSMSGAQTAFVKDATAGYWNPAGLLQLKSTYEIALMHSEYFAGIAKYDYLAFATRLDSTSSLGISIIRFGVDDIPDTRFLYDANGNINYNNIELFSAADYALLVSYARTLPFLKNLRFGANFKIIHRIAGDFANAWGFGIDAGIQYSKNTWNFGIMARDITGTFTAWYHNPDLVIDVFTQTGNEIPDNSIELTLPKAILGVSKSVSLGDHFNMLLALDLQTTFDGKRNVAVKTNLVSFDPAFGMEIGFKELAFVRGGIGDFQKSTEIDGSTTTAFQPNFGLGFIIRKVSIDYALTDVGDQSESPYSHVFSLKLNFEPRR